MVPDDAKPQRLRPIPGSFRRWKRYTWFIVPGGFVLRIRQPFSWLRITDRLRWIAKGSPSGGAGLILGTYIVDYGSDVATKGTVSR